MLNKNYLVLLIIVVNNLVGMENHFNQNPEILKRTSSCPAFDTKPTKTNEQKTQENDQCAICLESLYKNQEKEIVSTLFCKHSFHEACLHEWEKNQTTCPICRNKIGENKAAIEHDDIEAQKPNQDVTNSAQEEKASKIVYIVGFTCCMAVVATVFIISLVLSAPEQN